MQGKKKDEEMKMNIMGMTRAVELGEPCLFAKSCLTPFDPMSCSTPGFPVLHRLPELLKLMFIVSVMPSNHLILCRPLLLLPSIFPSIRVFSIESVLCIRWSEYWNFSFSISPSNEYPGLRFPLGLTGLISLQSKGLSRVFSSTTPASVLHCSAFFMVQLSHPYMNTGKTIVFTIRTFVGKVISLLFNTLSRFVIAFLPRSKHLLVLWLQSPSTLILEPKKRKSITISTFPHLFAKK